MSRDPAKKNEFDDALVDSMPAVERFFRRRAAPSGQRPSDLVQSVLREALDSRDRFEMAGEQAFRSWLLTIAHSKWVDRNRRAARRRGEYQGAPDVVDHEDARLGPAQLLELRDEVRRLQSAVDQLSATERRVVIACMIQGLPRATVAEELGKSSGAVRMMLHRALIQLGTNLRTSSSETDSDPPR